MNERDFDQFFRENIPTEQPFEFKESNWDDLAHRLQTVQTPKLSWWRRNTTLLAVASILLVSNVVWYNLWKSTEEEVQSIRSLIGNKIEGNSTIHNTSNSNLNNLNSSISNTNTSNSSISNTNTSNSNISNTNTSNVSKKLNTSIVPSASKNMNSATNNATTAIVISSKMNTNTSDLSNNNNKSEEKSTLTAINTNLLNTTTLESAISNATTTAENTNNRTTTTNTTATTTGINTNLISKESVTMLPSLTLASLKEPKTKLPRLDEDNDYQLLRPATKHRSTINNRFVVGLSRSWIGVTEHDFDQYQEGLTRLNTSFRLTNKFELFASGALGEKSIKGRGQHGPHQPENVPQGVAVKRFEQEDHIGQASIGLRYNLLSFKGFTPFVSSEYLYQFVEHKDSRFFGEDQSGKPIFLPTDLNKFKNNQAQYAMFGAGLKYNLTPRWMFTSNINYEKEITRATKERLDRYSLWLGVAYVIK